MSTPTLLLDGVGRLFREKRELQAGVHMKVLGQALNSKSKSDINEAHTVAMSIMDASSEKDGAFELQMDALALKNSAQQRSFAAKLIRYKHLPISAQSDELPDDFDLMDSDIALDTIMNMGTQYENGALDIYTATDQILNLPKEEQAGIIVRGIENAGYNANHLVPLGLEMG
tara:strand:+ start:1457 stop:1972 length:516 start_codon:yes stop_codon:yes gene_type:complete